MKNKLNENNFEKWDETDVKTFIELCIDKINEITENIKNSNYTIYDDNLIILSEITNIIYKLNNVCCANDKIIYNIYYPYIEYIIVTENGKIFTYDIENDFNTYN